MPAFCFMSQMIYVLVPLNHIACDMRLVLRKYNRLQHYSSFQFFFSSEIYYSVYTHGIYFHRAFSPKIFTNFDNWQKKLIFHSHQSRQWNHLECKQLSLRRRIPINIARGTTDPGYFFFNIFISCQSWPFNWITGGFDHFLLPSW